MKCENAKKIIGPIILLIIGIYFTLKNIFGIDVLQGVSVSFGNIWPLMIILIAIMTLIKK